MTWVIFPYAPEYTPRVTQVVTTEKAGCCLLPSIERLWHSSRYNYYDFTDICNFSWLYASCRNVQHTNRKCQYISIWLHLKLVMSLLLMKSAILVLAQNTEQYLHYNSSSCFVLELWPDCRALSYRLLDKWWWLSLYLWWMHIEIRPYDKWLDWYFKLYSNTNLVSHKPNNNWKLR